MVRIDHFRGFQDYYSIPYGDKNARGGKWVKGPGWDLFSVVKETFKDKPVIAEDLGFITPSVRRLIKKCGYPNMKIMMFGFEADEISEHAPFTYDHNCVVYTGTHDNDTITAWFKKFKGLGKCDILRDPLDRSRRIDRVKLSRLPNISFLPFSFLLTMCV